MKIWLKFGLITWIIVLFIYLFAVTFIIKCPAENCAFWFPIKFKLLYGVILSVVSFVLGSIVGLIVNKIKTR